MNTFLIALALQAGPFVITAEKPHVSIFINNVYECANASSRIAEGNRRRAQWQASALVRKYLKEGYRVTIVRQESTGDAGFVTDGGTVVRIDNGAC